MEDNKTSVYVYCDPRFTNKNKGYKYKFGKSGKIRMKYRPFYIGASVKKNIHCHLYYNKSNISVQARIKEIRNKEIEPVVIVIKSFNEQVTARKLEEKLIIAIGRKDLNSGPLLNKSDGPGTKNPSAELKKKRNKKSSQSMKAWWKNPDNMKKMSTRNLGEKSGNTHLHNCEIFEIRRLYSIGSLSYSFIGKMFKVSSHCIRQIVNGNSWKHLDDPLGYLDFKRNESLKRNRKLHNCEIQEIRRLYATGCLTHESLGKMFKRATCTITQIINYKLAKNI